MEDELILVEDIIGSKTKGKKPLLPISRSTGLAGVKDGIFPKPVRLGERRIAWFKSDIIEYIEKIKRER